MDVEVRTNAEDDFMRLARDRYKRAKDYWEPIYQPLRNDLEFFVNPDGTNQWPEHVVTQRSLPGQQRPTLTINRLPQFHNQIVNDYRQATISMRARPQGVEDAETAQTYLGLFRQIEKESHAQTAYIMALSHSSTMGIGWLRALTEYENEDTFDQTIRLPRQTNPFVHYPDPSAKGFFLEDREYHFVLGRMRKEEYKALYDKDESIENFDSSMLEPDWVDDEDVIIAEYFYYDYTFRTLIQFANGQVAFADELEKGSTLPEIVNKRKVRARKLKWCKIDGTHVLQKTEWPTKRIPIVPVWGNEWWIGERRVIEGFVHNAKDSQRMYNYYQSAKAEMIALAPKAPYIAAKGQMEGVEDDWKNAATTPKAVLTYNPIDVNGHLVGPPQRQAYEAPVQAIIQASAQSSDDMKATIGVYDASLGAKGNETSGLAIERRQREGDTATYNYVDNLSLSIGYLGLCCAELFPKIYDTARTLLILGEDHTEKMVKVNEKDADGKPVEGSPQIVDVRYDLVLDTGPSAATAQEEATRVITELSHNYPALLQVAGDIAVGSMSFKGAREIAARLKRTIPPEVVGPDEDPVTKLHVQEQQLQQGKETIEALTAALEKLKQDNEKLELKLESKNGELEIKREEVQIKRLQLVQSKEANEQAEKAGKDTVQSQTALLDAILSLGAKMEETQDIILAAVAEDDDGSDQEPAPMVENTQTETENDDQG